MSPFVKSRPVITFILFGFLAYGISWTIWQPILQRIQPNLMSMEPDAIALFMLGGAGPSLAAIVFSFLTGGPRAVGSLLAKIGRWRVGGQWYLAAILFAPLVTLGGVALYAAMGNPVGPVRWDHWWVILAFYAVAIFLGPLLEETGWRGFAQPVLLARFSIPMAGLMIGTLWTFWHAPLWFAAEGSSLSGGDFSIAGLMTYWLFLIGQSVLVAAILVRARGSVLIAMLVHQGVNAGAIGWLFYEIPNADKSLVFEQLPVLTIWIIVAIVGLAGGFKKPSGS